MENFEKINFDTFLDYYEFAETNNTLIRQSESDHLKFFDFTFRNNIDMNKVKESKAKLPGSRSIIIREGIHKGLYIYSWNMDNPDNNYCYKYNS